MNPIRIRTLRPDDADRLLQFERDNRAWFERHIAPRGDAFYSPDGVRDHILEFLAAHRAGRLHPCLLLGANDTVLGRVNLRNIDATGRSADVGYRIAESHAGRGLATLAVRHLIDLARSRWRLARLVADVAATNTASARVLDKCGFVRATRATRHAAGSVDAYRFVLDLAPA